jgi:hypothetical protein
MKHFILKNDTGTTEEKFRKPPSCEIMHKGDQAAINECNKKRNADMGKYNENQEK